MNNTFDIWDLVAVAGGILIGLIVLDAITAKSRREYFAVDASPLPEHVMTSCGRVIFIRSVSNPNCPPPFVVVAEKGEPA